MQSTIGPTGRWKVQLHVHTNRYSSCAKETPEAMLQTLADLGYHAVFLTEHDRVWPKEELAVLRSQFAPLRIYGGIELTIDQAHLLILGTSDPSFLKSRNAGDAIRRARSQGCLTILAHPYRWEHSANILDAGARPDAIELHTRNHHPDAAQTARGTARRLGLRGVNCADAHERISPSAFWIQTFEPVENATDIRRIILNGQYRNMTNPDRAKLVDRHTRCID